MAHLWIKDEMERWSVLQLPETAFALTMEGPRPASDLSARGLATGVLLAPTGGADCKWVLIAGAATEASVNGMPVVAGIRILADRDEIHVANLDSYYFSTEALASIESAPPSESTFFCPRCKQEVTEGTSAVRCPACGVWHHESDELNCWTYSEHCALCAHSTEMNGMFQWTPEDI